MALDRKTFHSEVVWGLGFYAQKVLVTLNAGGIVALLGFISNIGDSKKVAFDVEWLKWCVFGFLVGLMLVGLSLVVTYWNAQKKIIDPNLSDGNFFCFMVKMTGSLLLSFAAFFLAIVFALFGIQTVAPQKPKNVAGITKCAC